ncbi:hypothetical protein BGZ76_000405 [Entomortierella beljakovae]|nr:hypothetical protein BGZ76_000405 [Entomortierella beljakovae]
MSFNAVFNPPLPPRPRQLTPPQQQQQQHQHQHQQLQQQQQQQQLRDQQHQQPPPPNYGRQDEPFVNIIPSSRKEPRIHAARTPSPTPPVQNTLSQARQDSSNNNNSSSSSNNNHHWQPGPSISPSLQPLDGVQRFETTFTPFRRSLDGQRPTPHVTQLKLDKPLPTEPHLRDSMPPLLVTSNHSRSFSASAPPSASANGPMHQDNQFLSSSYNNPSPLSHHRISTGSVPASNNNSPYPYHDELYIPSRQSLDQQSIHQLPPYSVTPVNHGSTILVPPTEEALFQVQELTLSSFIRNSSNQSSLHQSTTHNANVTTAATTAAATTAAAAAPYQYICADPMHDQQYLLVGSGNALHSIDLTLPSERQTVKTHIQGLAFKEIHCLEEIGLVVVIAGRNSRVRCYDYDSIMRLVSYGHSLEEGQSRPVDGGKLGTVKNMIQLRVETAIQRDDNQGGEPSRSSPVGPSSSSSSSRILKGMSLSTPSAFQQPPPPQNRHQHTNSTERTSLLSPPSRVDSPGGAFDFKDDSDTTSIKKSKPRPISFAGWASLAQEHVMRNKGQQQQQQQPSSSSSFSTPTSPNSANSSGTKNNRLSMMASYLTQAAANTNMAMQLSGGSDGPSTEAINWATDFTKLKQTKDVLGLDFHYTVSTVYMTVLSKTGIDIFSRPKAVRGRKPVPVSVASPGNNIHSNPEDSKRASMMSMGGGMVASATRDSFSSIRDNPNSYEWRLHKQFYHPEAPSFMTVVKDLQEVTDIILGKGPRACIINVETMSVDDLQRQGNNQGGVFQGLGKKLGFKNHHPLWHSFEKIPFDVPPFILYPEAAAAIYEAQRDTKERYSSSSATSSSTVSSSFVPSSTSTATATVTATTASNLDPHNNNNGYNESSGLSDYARRSRDDIIQRPSDQHTIHQQQLEEQERAEAENIAMKLQKTLMITSCSSSPNSNPSSSTSSLSSPLPPQPPQQQQQQSLPSNIPPHSHLNNGGIISNTNGNGNNSKANKKTRMVTSDEVLHMAFCQRTTTQLFLATYGTQSRIVDIRGKPQSPVILEWESSPPQKVEFLKTDQDIYVIGFEKSCIVIFSLTRAKKIKEISKLDLIRAADSAILSASTSSTFTNRHSFALSPAANIATTPGNNTSTSTSTTTSSSSSRGNRMSVYESSQSSIASTNSSIKFLGRDSFADNSLGIFFSYCHPRNGTAICKLGLIPIARDDLELVGYYA